MASETKPIYAPNVIDFITVAAEYCVFLERLQENGSRSDFLARVTRLLPLIYVKATLLPVVEEIGEDELQEIVTEDDYEFVRRSVWNVLRADDEYLEVFTADMQYSDTPLGSTISEDLADIYQDLKNFVAAYANNNEISMNDAIVKVQENFRTYWGQKLVNAMRPLHSLMVSAGPEEEDL